MPETLRLNKLRFRAGPEPEAPPLEIEPSTVVLLVGPNNAGKSLALREIEALCDGSAPQVQGRVLTSVSTEFPTDPDAVLELLRPFMQKISPAELRGPDLVRFVQHSFRQGGSAPRQMDVSELELRARSEHDNREWLERTLPAWFTARLDGRARFSLTESQPGGNLQERPQNHLAALFVDDAARERVRQLTEAAFDLHFVIDPTELGQLKIGMSSRAAVDSDEERGLNERAIAFHRGATPIAALGDGVKAFTGLVAAVQSLPHRILLVDEPEAFLHPPLARRLGAALAELARSRNASLVVATHSAEFVLACVETVADTSVVRLGYDATTGVATAKALPPTVVAELARHPLMRSANVLRALFHRAAVVSESDADRVFYDEMNRRLVEEGRGVRDALFLNCQGKDSIYRVVGPLRRIGIPAAAVVDLDVMTGGAAWQTIVEACCIPEERREYLRAEREILHQVFATIPRQAGDGEPLKKLGLQALGAGDRARAEALLGELAAYGMFVVPGGELETWLPNIGGAGHGPAWIENLFSRIGVTPGGPDYLRPAAEGIWAFIDGIEQWVSHPNRRGMA